MCGTFHCIKPVWNGTAKKEPVPPCGGVALAPIVGSVLMLRCGEDGSIREREKATKSVVREKAIPKNASANQDVEALKAQEI